MWLSIVFFFLWKPGVVVNFIVKKKHDVFALNRNRSSNLGQPLQRVSAETTIATVYHHLVHRISALTDGFLIFAKIHEAAKGKPVGCEQRVAHNALAGGA
jgi:hypothetical protein